MLSRIESDLEKLSGWDGADVQTTGCRQDRAFVEHSCRSVARLVANNSHPHPPANVRDGSDGDAVASLYDLVFTVAPVRVGIWHVRVEDRNLRV